MDIFDKAYNWTEADLAREMGLYPYFLPLQDTEGTEVVVEGRKILMIGSNNYLGLTTDPRVREAAIEAVKRYGTAGVDEDGYGSVTRREIGSDSARGWGYVSQRPATNSCCIKQIRRTNGTRSRSARAEAFLVELELHGLGQLVMDGPVVAGLDPRPHLEVDPVDRTSVV